MYDLLYNTLTDIDLALEPRAWHSAQADRQR
jgi:hypothetical protein